MFAGLFINLEHSVLCFILYYLVCFLLSTALFIILYDHRLGSAQAGYMHVVQLVWKACLQPDGK